MKLKNETLAPEEGLEPSTTRLTAACSTIELLWNANGREMYKSQRCPSISFVSFFDTSTEAGSSIRVKKTSFLGFVVVQKSVSIHVHLG
jgi:hypothetical protein